jgi:hypothetical protein
MAASRANEMESRRLGGHLLLMRDPIGLNPGVRVGLLGHINTLRPTTAYEGVNAQQRMRVIDDAGLAPSDAAVERFLNAAGQFPSGADFSGVIPFCTTQGLPVEDWRDYRKLAAIQLTFPDAPDAR